MSEKNIHRLWKPIGFEDGWRGTDTSILDDLSSAWFARRARLRLDSKAYVDFLERLKREHAIETGVVERLYDIDRGVTETLIQQGFVEGFLSHGDANIPSDQLMRHLKDHLEALDFVFDLIKEERPLTTGYIKELHSLVTRSQLAAEGRDSFGNRTQIKLLKGTYKEWENNPTRSDGTVIMYCPPIQVASEMDQLVHIYHGLEDEGLHPLIIAAWVHHAFTTIHPFQDGNGRVVRLLASLILIKHNLFPITVLREEAKLKYILALEKADAGEPNELVRYFAMIQKRQIERALDFEGVVSESLEEVENLLAERIASSRRKEILEMEIQETRRELIEVNRAWVSMVVFKFLSDRAAKLRSTLGENTRVEVERVVSLGDGLSIDDVGLAQYAQRHDQPALPDSPVEIIRLQIDVASLHIGYSIWIIFYHPIGEEGVFALGSYYRLLRSKADAGRLHLGIPPHLLSLLDSDMSPKQKNIVTFLEEALILALSDMYNQIK